MFAILSVILTAITILKHELFKLELEIKEARDLKNKLEYDLSFMKAEWEYISSPRNIQKLSNLYLDYKHASLISFNDFLKILENQKGIK